MTAGGRLEAMQEVIAFAYCWPPAVLDDLTLDQLEPYFSDWEAKWIEREKDLNNPKIPLKFVMEAGELVFSD